MAPFIATAPALEALERMGRGLGARKPFVVLSGDPGTGKSTLAREAVRRMATRVTARTLAASDAAADTLLATLLGTFGGTARSQASAPALMERLVEALANCTAGGRVAVLVMDDAHQVAPEALLQLQRVAEAAARRQCPLEVLLVGLPELVARLGEPPLAAVAERVSVRVETQPLSQTDTRHYLLQRSGADGAAGSGMFSRKACRDIHSATLGVQRAIEALADEAARRAARVGATTVSPEHVRAAAQALRSRRGASPPTVIAPRAERLAGVASAAKKDGMPNGVGSDANPEPGETLATGARGDEATAARAPSSGAVSPSSPVERPAVAAGPPAPAAGSSSGELGFTPSNDPRVKDWVSRFGGSGVSIGVRFPQGRIQTFTDLDAPEPSTSRGVAAGVKASGASEAAPLPARAPRAKLPASTMRRRHRNTTWQWAAGVVAASALAIMLGQRSGFGRRASFDAADTSVRPIADSLAHAPRHVPEMRVPKPARSTSAAVAPLPATPVEEAERRFSVVVGTFLSHDMALAEKDHLARLTAYRVWVSSARVQGVRTYRLMVGRFDSTEAAESAAQTLMRRGLIRDASVQPLSADATD